MAKDKKKDGKKTEKSARPPVPSCDTTAESSSPQLVDLQTLVNGVDEAQENPVVLDKEPEEAEEPPVQDVPQYYEEPSLTEVIVKSYEGEKVHGLYEGEGFACFEGGNTYKGMFSEGFMHGQGTYTWADGVKYEGTFVKNVQMLNGRYTWNDGSIYEGSVKNGLRHGFGFFRSGTCPVSYIGYWCKGKRHGKGTVYYDKEHTSWYSGDWVNNIKEGWGMRCYKSGNTYEGQWEKNVRHGRGRMRWLTANQEYMGQWVYGIQHGYGTHIWFLKRMPMSQYPLRNQYIGDFVNGQRHGHGKFIYASGAVYDGEWVCNKKHGKGKFVFKNGLVYEGGFIGDRIVESAAFQMDAMDAEELNAICTGSYFGTENVTIVNGSKDTSALGSNIELDLSSLLDLLPREERHEEVKQVIKRHLRRYIVHIRLYCSGPSYLILFVWHFISIMKSTNEYFCSSARDKGPCLCKCFLGVMARNVTPAACHIQGTLFSEERCTVFAMNYLDKCWGIYRAFCKPSTRPPFEPTMTMRHFLCMLNDFKLLSKQLTASRVVEIVVNDGPPLHDSSSTSLERELVFLEFVEALLDCALVFVTGDVIKEQADRDNQKRSSFGIAGQSEGTTDASLYPEYSLSQCTTNRSAAGTDINDEISEAADHAWLSSTTVVPSQDEIKKHESQGPCEGRGQPQELLLDTILSFHTTPGDTEDAPSLLSRDAEKEQGFSAAKEVTDVPEEAKTEQDAECSLWMCQMQIFFTTKFFPAYQHEEVLVEKMKENRVRDAELAELRKNKDEELAKIIAEREAEEAKRQVAEKALDSRSAHSKEPEEPDAPAVKEPSGRSQPPVSKAPAGKRKKKRSAF
ncbi:radial spoke head 10 homolog B isoform X4 [Columba livia]|uniref:radial spoke head 10 homolog B isoform X4 n=1 Tax=Columba livia TaxID=8932 RepID=UPI0031BAAC29